MEVNPNPSGDNVFKESIIPDSTPIKIELDAAALQATIDAANPGDIPSEKSAACKAKADARKDKNKNPEGKEDIALQRIRELAAQLQAIDVCADISDLADYAIDELKALGKQIIKKQKKIADKKLPPMKLPAPTPPSILSWIKKLVAGDALVQFEAFIRTIKQAIAYIQALMDIIKAVQNIAQQIQQCSIKGILEAKAKNEIDKAMKALENEIRKQVGEGACSIMGGLGISLDDINKVINTVNEVKDVVSAVKSVTNEIKSAVTSSYSSVKTGQANIDEGYGIQTKPFDIPASTAAEDQPYQAPEYSAAAAAAFVETAEECLADIDTKVAEAIKKLVDQAQAGALQHDTLSVVDFGAKGDGITNDTGAFVNAISRMIGGTIIVPYGDYLVDSIEIPEFITLAGDVEGPYDVEENVLRYDANNVIILYGTSRANTTLYRAPTLRFTPGSHLTLTGKHSNVQDLLFFYPDQEPTISSPSVANATIIVEGPEEGHRISRCTFVNSYDAIQINAGRTTVENCIIGAYHKDIIIDTANTDVTLSRIVCRPNWNNYFNLSYPQNIDAWTKNNSTSLDVKSVNNLSVSQYKTEKRYTGINFANTGSGHGQLSDVTLESVVYGVVANATNSFCHGYNFNNLTIISNSRDVKYLSSNSVATIVLNGTNGNNEPVITWDGGAAVGIFANNVYPIKNAGRCYVTNVRGINEEDAVLLPVFGSNTFPQTNTYITNPYSIPVNIYFEDSPHLWIVAISNTQPYKLGEKIYLANSTATFIANGTIANINSYNNTLYIRMSTGTFPVTDYVYTYANSYNVKSYISSANAYVINSASYTSVPADVNKVFINNIPVQYNYHLKPNDRIRVDYTYDSNIHFWHTPQWIWVGAE